MIERLVIVVAVFLAAFVAAVKSGAYPRAEHAYE